jgi:flavin-dependent dehydrogenase
VVDRATFPSDTVSTHILHPLGAKALGDWGLLDRLRATGCPPIHTYAFDFGPITLAGAPGTEESPVAYCPRRIVLDKLLVDAAAESGAEVREGFTVDEILIEDGRVVGVRGRSKRGGAVVERADFVVGADGRHSLVADTVRPEEYDRKPPLLAGYYSYWSGLPMDGRFETYIREKRGFAAVPTHDDLTMVIVGWPYVEFAENRKDIEGYYLKSIELAPAFADRLRGARREARFAGAAVPNYFRKPYGPSWALVGDAGYYLDFITPKASPTPCATPSSAPRQSTRQFPEGGFSGRRWGTISAHEMTG